VRAKNSSVASKRTVRILLVVYLLTWLVGVTYTIFDSTHEVSEAIADHSWRFFSAASILNILFLWISSLCVFFLGQWSRWIFLANILYAMVYALVFGAGQGSNLAEVIGTTHILLAGAILCLLFLTEEKCEDQSVGG